MAYIHKEDTHNLGAPMQIVPVINSLVHPASVIDVGCGVGTFLYAFKQLGVSEVLGIDGEWVNKELLKKYLSDSEFLTANLSEFIDVKRKFDLAVCLEVAEHISEDCADNLLATLTASSDLIIFSGAIPYQSGQFHVNEQWPAYWKAKFTSHDYVFIDVIRTQFWDEKFSEFWYKQNMFFAVRKNVTDKYPFLAAKQHNSPLNVVHPDLYIKNSRLLYDINTGKMPVGFYFKLFVKSILIKAGIVNR